MSSMIASGSSVRGLSRRHDRQVRAAHGGRAHQRALAAVPVAARTEHQDQPATHQRPQCREHTLQRVRRVRVVAQHGARRLRDALEPAGDLRHRAQALGHFVQCHAQRVRGARRGQCVLHVEVAEQRQLDRGAAARRLEREAGAARTDVQVSGTQIRRRIDGERQRPSLPFRERCPRRLLGVVDRDTAGAEQFHQRELRLQVRLDRAVVVEVVTVTGS